MSTAPRNLVSVQSVFKDYGARAVLRDVSLGVAGGERIGVVGRNGGGKSTLLRLLAGIEAPDRGEITRRTGLQAAHVAQADDLGVGLTIRQVLVGDRADHLWASDARFRDVLAGLLGGVGLTRFPDGIETPVGPLSGGERRRVALAKALLDDPELLLLDEPTNHLDVEGVDWLAEHLAARRGALVVVTHDRWFLDAVCEATWEVADTAVHRYDGGYSAYVLAKAERERIAAAGEERRQNLMRKELAWLRRGPPARTAKPRFRIEAANALIADVPEPRDRAQLARFATARLGKRVIDAEDLGVVFGGRSVIHALTWRLGPGDRVALVGVNGSGKSTLLRVLAGVLEPTSGSLERGTTVRLAHLTQEAAELPADRRVIESLEEIRLRTTLGDGREMTASQLCERFGFGGPRSRAYVRDLSGGERRRLQLMRLLMGEPNVLVLDEPTNDLDIDTLRQLEDLLDAWPGTLVVASHDRYFIERVCDNVHALTELGGIRHLPGGIDQYLAERRSTTTESVSGPARAAMPPGGAIRAARKEVARLERDIERHLAREAEILDRMRAVGSDYAAVAHLDAELAASRGERARLEEAWLEVAVDLDG